MSNKFKFFICFLNQPLYSGIENFQNQEFSLSWLSFFFSWLVAAAGCSAQEVSFQSFFTLGAERCFCTILTRLVRVSSPGQCDRISHKKTPRMLLCTWLPLLRGGECSKDGQGKQQQVSKGGIWACPYDKESDQ